MNTSENPSKARELLWLAVAIMSLFAALHKTIYVSFKDSLLFYVFVLVALLLYFIRRNLRKKEHK